MSDNCKIDIDKLRDDTNYEKHLFTSEELEMIQNELKDDTETDE